MNENDLRDCFAMFAMCGAIMRGETWIPKQIWDIADDMLEARRNDGEELGIAAVKPKRRYNRKGV
jgi:hypothetical protein